MVTEISTATRIEVLGAIRNRYREASKRDKSRMLDEFVALTGCHRKHAVRLLGEHERSTGRSVPRGRRIYDEAVRQALIVVWEASDRICGKRLKAALPSMVESLERHGHLDLDPDVRERLFSASASTMDRLLRPVRERAGSRRRLKRRRKMGSRVSIATVFRPVVATFFSPPWAGLIKTFIRLQLSGQSPPFGPADSDGERAFPDSWFPR